MNQCAVLTTAFNVENGVSESYFSSLAGQTYPFFDVVIVNDGFDGLAEAASRFPNLNIIELVSQKNIASNRELMIRYAVREQYQHVVFCDFDDYFSKNRIEKSIELLQYNDIVVNDIELFTSKGILRNNYISNRYRNLDTIVLEDILEKNFIGLSNSSVNVSIVEDVSFAEDLVAIDWYFFTLLMLKRPKAIFTNDALTFYRQYEGSFAQINRVDEHQLRKEIFIKKRHYSLLESRSLIFKHLLKEICDFECQIKDVPSLNSYLLMLMNRPVEFTLWWDLFHHVRKKGN